MVAFRLNGQDVIADVDPHLPLLHFLRERGLTGTKEGCAEGECGACAVLLVRRGPDGATRYVPMNACLVLTPAVHGEELVTVEGLAPSRDALHPVQEAMVKTGGSQCGYCTPGFIVSMYAEFYRRGREEGAPDLESIGGNLCRCTGYRPIREALVSLRVPSADDPAQQRLDAPPPEAPALHQGQDGALRFDRPTTLEALFEILQQDPDAKIVAGGTDVVVEINQLDRRFDHLVAIDNIDALRGIEDTDDALVIGAGEPLAFVEEALHGQVPMFDQLFPLFSSRLIRNRATFGGNLVNASPIGDGPPALLALDAELVLASAQGERTVALTDFFTGYRATVLEPGEIVRQVRVPKPFPTVQRFYKVSKRIMDDISTVAAGFGLWVEDGKVTKARLAYGGVAATPVRAHAAEDALVGQPWDDDSLARAAEAAGAAFSPITDHRGSARYRQAMTGKLVEKLAAEAL